MLVPGAYFRDEAIWRGRMVAFTCDLRAALYELGFWIGAMYVAFPLSKWFEAAPLVVGIVVCMRMLFGYLDELQGRKRIEKDVSRYFDETHPPSH